MKKHLQLNGLLMLAVGIGGVWINNPHLVGLSVGVLLYILIKLSWITKK